MSVYKKNNANEVISMTVTISPEMYAAIESFWHSAKFANRSDAVRALILSGLDNFSSVSGKEQDIPTAKQIAWVQNICSKHNLQFPEWSKKAYSDFIQLHKEKQ